MRNIHLFVILIFSLPMHAQEILPLYTSEIPNAKQSRITEVPFYEDGMIRGYGRVTVPTLTAFLPEKSTGTAVIICPGGGYIFETYKGEGTDIAQAFNRQGIAAFVLKYRLPSDSSMVDKSIGPLQDAQQAIKIVRQRSAEWNINPNRIGIMGFSAGGHLASTAGTHFNQSYINNPEKVSLRPDFMILCYPVISTDPEISHLFSIANLIGKNPSEQLIRMFSNELQVSSDTPPSLLIHSGDDPDVPVENSIRFYQALIKHKIPAEMHLYTTGEHAFILKLKPEEWMVPVFDWIKKLQ